MTAARDDTRDAERRTLAPDERSAVDGIRGLRWWVVVLIAGGLAALGVVGDMWLSGQLGVVFTICFPAGAILGAVWVRRGEQFATMVQPPLLLAVTVPLGVAVSGSLPASGGLTATLLAVGGPMINGFPTMAITTVACLVIAFVRSRLQPLAVPDDPDDAPAPPRRTPPRRTPERDQLARDRPARPDSRRAEPRPSEGRPRPSDDRRPVDGRDAAGRNPAGRGQGAAGEGGTPAKGPSGRPGGPSGRRPPAGEPPGDGPAPGVRRVPGPSGARPRSDGPRPEGSGANRPRPPDPPRRPSSPPDA